MKLRLSLEAPDLAELFVDSLAARGYHITHDDAMNAACLLLVNGTGIDLEVTHVERPKAPAVVSAPEATPARKRHPNAVQGLPTPASPPPPGLSKEALKDSIDLTADEIERIRMHNTTKPEIEDIDPDNTPEVIDEISSILKTSTNIQKQHDKDKKKVLQ